MRWESRAVKGSLVGDRPPQRKYQQPPKKKPLMFPPGAKEVFTSTGEAMKQQVVENQIAHYSTVVYTAPQFVTTLRIHTGA
jgi:hypothetical protein